MLTFEDNESANKAAEKDRTDLDERNISVAVHKGESLFPPLLSSPLSATFFHQFSSLLLLTFLFQPSLVDVRPSSLEACPETLMRKHFQLSFRRTTSNSALAAVLLTA